MNGDTVIETARLVLRRMRHADGEALFAVLGDPHTMLHYPRPFDREMVERWIDRALASYAEHGYGLYTVVLQKTGEIVGDCGFAVQHVDRGVHTEIGYHLGRRHWGNLYATEAAVACRDYAFGSLDCKRLISLIRPQNVASQRVAQRVGMTVEKDVEYKGLPHLMYAIRNAGDPNDTGLG